MKRSSAYSAIFLCLLCVAALRAQAPSQPQTPSSGSMDGMDMSKPADSGQAAGSGKAMDMCHCMSNMNSDGKQMDMGKGSGSKAMDMSCMAMMHGAMDHSNVAPIPPGVLRVTFDGKSTDWKLATLAPLPHATVTVYNEHTRANETYSGAPVIALLTPLGVSDKPRGRQLRLYVVAEGSDGYEVVYSIGEVTPDLHDATVIVADTENDKPLAADGPLKLISTGEKRPARWVRNLVALRVQVAE